MKQLLRQWRFSAAFLAVAFAISGVGAPLTALAGTTGIISGTVRDASTGAPLANVKVTAASPSQSGATVTDSRGFYVLSSLTSDTYTVSFQAQGYTPIAYPGAPVFADQTLPLDVKLSKELTTIANVHARSATSLVQPNVTSDLFTVSDAQLNAISGGNDLHKTLYQYVQGVAGVTSSGFPAQPRIHGGNITDIAYEFDGVPIKERMTGLFTSNLSNVGIKNVEVYTGGLSAGDAASGLGIINTVVKSGTYPGFGIVSYGATTNTRNTALTIEYGGATPNQRFSWYGALDKTNSLNEYASGLTYPALEIEGGNGPGPVKTTDVIGNFHYKPNQKDNFQLLFQNGVGEFIYSYLMQRAPGQPIPLTAVPCQGAHADPTTYTGGTGGVAPNGQGCPLGLYFGTANTQQGGGNIWHHYSGIGKVQWNHIINDRSFFALRVAENYNEYIFDQPVVEANLLPYEDGDFAVSAKCPALPYQAGTPILNANYPATGGRACAQQSNWLSTGYWQNRRSEMYLAALDYTNTINANVTIKAGIGDEYDRNNYDVYYTEFFNADGTWPAVNFKSDYPDHIPYAYAEGNFKLNRFLISPGMRYQREYYDYPGGPLEVGIWNPTFAATYTMGPGDVIRGSYTNSNSFVGTGYVYRNVPQNALNGFSATTPYMPTHTGFAADPTVFHSGDIQWEHQINYNTQLKFGPWFNRASNIFYLYKPVTSAPDVFPVTYGPQVPQNGGVRNAFGFEAALNHVDTRKSGISYWLTGTYDNFWTSITSSLTSSFGVTPLPPTAYDLIRSTYDPLFSGTLTLDIHQDDFSLLPMFYYQTPTFYNIGVLSSCSVGTTSSKVTCAKNGGVFGAPHIAQNELQSTGYWMANVTALWRAGQKKDLVLGVQVTNLFNNTHDIAPCNATQLGASVGTLYPGCAPFWPSGQGGPNIPNLAPGQSSSVYQNYSQTPVTVQFFITKKL